MNAEQSADYERGQPPAEKPDGYLPRHDLKTAESHIKWLEAEVLRLRAKFADVEGSMSEELMADRRAEPALNAEDERCFACGHRDAAHVQLPIKRWDNWLEGCVVCSCERWRYGVTQVAQSDGSND